MDTYKLTEEEKTLLRKIDEPCIVGGERFTRPVIVVYSKNTNLLVGLSSLTQWRGIIKHEPTYKERFDFELRNMW